MKKSLFLLLLVLSITRITIAQGLEVDMGTDVSNATEQNGYLIIGDTTSSMVFDINEIQVKSNLVPGGNQFINDRGGNTIFATSSNNPNGKVIIGQINGPNKLTVKVEGNDGIGIVGDGTDDAGLRISNTGGNHFLADNASDNHSLALRSSSDLTLETNGTVEAMRIKSDGKIFVAHNTIGGYNAKVSCVQADELTSIHVQNDKATGNVVGLLGQTTTGTGDRRGVVGFAGAGGSGAEVTGVQGLTSTVDADAAYGVYGEVFGTTGTTNRFGVYGKASSNSGQHWAIYGNGDFYYSGSLTAPSDAQLKKNIASPNENYLEKVLSLNVKTYEYKHEDYPHINFASGNQIGFIAQELREIFPDIVQTQHHTFPTINNHGEKELIHEDLLGVDYIKLIPILVKSMQEQQAIIDQLILELHSLQSE